jgi:hypothetical protein
VAAAPDTTAPETSISNGPAQDSTTESTSATFEFGSTEAGTFECSLDGAAFSACTSPAALSGLAVGPHTFRVRSRDGSGNVDATPATRAWTVKAPASTGGGETGTGTGTGTGTDTGTGTGTGTTIPPALPFAPHVTSAFDYKGSTTRYTMLKLTGLPKGTKVVAACKGGGCRFKRRTVPVAGSSLNVLKKLKALRLRSGATLKLTITGPAGDVKVTTWRIRKAKAPITTYRCAAKGAKLGRCA